MVQHRSGPRALFLVGEGKLVPDHLVCSGVFPSHLAGKRCPFSEAGRMPEVAAVSENLASIEGLNRAGELAPPCAIRVLGKLQTWQGEHSSYSVNMRNLRLFKCKQMFLLVIPGLTDQHPSKLIEN